MTVLINSVVVNQRIRMKIGKQNLSGTDPGFEVGGGEPKSDFWGVFAHAV